MRANDLSGFSSGVVVGAGGVLYCTATGGGASQSGGVFSLTPPSVSGGAWTESLLYSFMGGNDGSQPFAGVVVGNDGVLYGTTEYGGTGTCNAYTQPPGCGVVFSLTSPSSPGVAWTE